MFIKGSLDFLEKLYRQRTVVFCLFVAVLTLAIDYITGKHIQFPIVYVLPVGMAAWRRQMTAAYAIAIFAPLARVGFHLLWHDTESLPVAFLNAPITMSALIFYSYLVDRVAWQTSELEKEIRVLQGILPVCASCKRIRNDKGEYEQIEQYITDHSEASFTHGICPECARKLYPEFFQEGDG